MLACSLSAFNLSSCLPTAFRRVLPRIIPSCRTPLPIGVPLEKKISTGNLSASRKPLTKSLVLLFPHSKVLEKLLALRLSALLHITFNNLPFLSPSFGHQTPKQDHPGVIRFLASSVPSPLSPLFKLSVLPQPLFSEH